MSWTIRFDFLVLGCSDGTMAPSSLSHRTSPTVVALSFNRIVIMSCGFCCFYVVVGCVVVICVTVCCIFVCSVVVSFFAALVEES